MSNKSLFDIDLVYLWVDGSDSAWRAKKAALSNLRVDDATDGAGRYADNDELRYSLRSVALYAPWIRNIFIVTDNQTPCWLDTSNPKVHIIDHKDILPAEALPTFNSTVIEHALHRIPGLAEHFLYANDDMFFNRPVSTEDFFTADGRPIVRFNRRPLRRFTLMFKEKILGKPLSNYNRTIQNAARLVKQRYGRYIGHKTHHNIDAYRRSDYEHTFMTFRDDIDAVLTNHLRSDNDIQRNLYTYVPVAEGKAEVRFVNQRTSLRLHIDHPETFVKLAKYNPMLFCVNDSQYVTDDNRRATTAFLRELFPQPSPFEKQPD